MKLQVAIWQDVPLWAMLTLKVSHPNIIGKMSGHVEGSKAFSRYRKIEDSTLLDVINQLG